MRWGVDASTATEFDLPKRPSKNTWLFGIQRMLLDMRCRTRRFI
ncbi:exodeoxyribonuclease V subunit gamma [Vibrio lentus]|nr:exodeoxyribonuclease V subunit gamma [Vibrio lentus]